MKLLRYLPLLFLGLFVACDQEEFEGSGLESLRDVALNPVPNSRIALNSLAPEEEIIITWEPAKSGFDSPVTYEWLLSSAEGNIEAPLASLPSDNEGKATQITFTNDELEALLAELGVEEGAEFDALWSVRATNGDVTKIASPLSVTLMRYSEAIMGFELLSPVSGTTLFLEEALANEAVTIDWESTISGIGSEVTYTFLLDEAGEDFSVPLVSIPSDDNGTASQITFTHQQLENALADAGIAAQSLASLQWTVKATAGEVTEVPEPFAINLVRWGTEVTIKLTSVPANTPASKNIYVAGSFGFLGAGIDDWQQPGTNSSLQMMPDGSGNYLLTINVPKDYSFEYKYFLATEDVPAWEYGEQQFNATNDGCKGLASNRSFTFDGTQNLIENTVETWEGLCPFDVVTVTLTLNNNIEVPEGYNVYVAGEFGNLGVAEGNWQEPGSNQELKFSLNNENKYQLQLAVPKSFDNTTIQYKYFIAPEGATAWSYGEQSFTETACAGLPYGNAEGTDNRRFTFSVPENGDVFVDATVLSWEGFCNETTQRVKFEVTVPETTPASLDVYITGGLGFISWPQPGTAAGLRMNKTGDYTYEIWLPVPVGQEVQYKYFLATTNQPAWNQGEQVINATNDGCAGKDNRSFTFDGSNGPVTDVVETWEGFCPF